MHGAIIDDWQPAGTGYQNKEGAAMAEETLQGEDVIWCAKSKSLEE